MDYGGNMDEEGRDCGEFMKFLVRISPLNTLLGPRILILKELLMKIFY